MALLGNNGAGKTTLIRLVAGLAKPDRGEIRLGGAVLKHAGHELRRYVGLVSHSPLLYTNLTGMENLRFFARLYDLPNPDEHINELLTTVDLWIPRNDRVRTYSRGMVQRLAIARSILHSPPILLLDEPDTGLDQASTDRLQKLIEQISSADRAILLTTHNLENALRWSDSLSFLVHGQIKKIAHARGLSIDSLRALYQENN